MPIYYWLYAGYLTKTKIMPLKDFMERNITCREVKKNKV